MTMDKRYVEDDAEYPGHATFFGFPNSQTVITGTKWLAMDSGERNPAYDAIENSHGIRFLYNDSLPVLPFYTVPAVYLFAEVETGGYLGRFPAEGTISESVCYFKDGQCYLVASDIKAFLADPCWKEKARECPLIEVFHSREQALQHYDIVLASTLLKRILKEQS